MAGDAILATVILAGMCGLMWLLARIAKKRMGIGSGVVAGDALRIVGKRPLDQKSSLWVVEIAGGRHILLGSGADGTVTKLDDISADEYSHMTEADAPVAARPKLRLANRKQNDANPTEEGEEPRFATTGEAFRMLLAKAKDARADRKASGD